MPILLDLFLTFAKIGAFTFGGGYAMISIVEYNCVERKAWITHDDMMNMTVIAESTPGPIAINCATFTGYKIGGVPGAVCATLGIVFPSFVIIYAISMFLDRFMALRVVANAFQGIRIAVGFLILDAALGMMKKMRKNPLAKGILSFSCVVMLLINLFSWNFSSISLMLIAGIVSLAIFTVSSRKGGRDR